LYNLGESITVCAKVNTITPIYGNLTVQNNGACSSNICPTLTPTPTLTSTPTNTPSITVSQSFNCFCLVITNTNLGYSELFFQDCSGNFIDITFYTFNETYKACGKLNSMVVVYGNASVYSVGACQSNSCPQVTPTPTPTVSPTITNTPTVTRTPFPICPTIINSFLSNSSISDIGSDTFNGYFYVSNSGQTIVYNYQYVTSEVTRLSFQFNNMTKMSFDNLNLKMYFTDSSNNQIKILDSLTLTYLNTISFSGSVSPYEISYDETNQLFITNSSTTNEIIVLNSVTDQVTRYVNVPNSPNGKITVDTVNSKTYLSNGQYVYVINHLNGITGSTIDMGVGFNSSEIDHSINKFWNLLYLL
jgi:hypothetical protein